MRAMPPAFLASTGAKASPQFATLLTGAVTYAGDSTSAAQAALAGAFRMNERSAWLTEGGISGAAFGSSLLSRGGSFSAFARERFGFDALRRVGGRRVRRHES